MVVLSFIVFAGALATSMAVILLAVGPQWRRIVQLAMGRVETPALPFAPLRELAVAERRIAVRRWASQSAPAPAWVRAAA